MTDGRGLGGQVGIVRATRSEAAVFFALLLNLFAKLWPAASIGQLPESGGIAMIPDGSLPKPNASGS